MPKLNGNTCELDVEVSELANFFTKFAAESLQTTGAGFVLGPFVGGGGGFFFGLVTCGFFVTTPFDPHAECG